MFARNDPPARYKHQLRGEWDSAKLLIGLRVGIAIGLIALLLWFVDLRKVLDHMMSVEPMYLVAALLTLSAQYLLAFLRWHYVLRRHQLPVFLRYSFITFGLSKLSDSFLLTTVAGISIRAVLLLRKGYTTSRVAGVLLAERLAVVGGLVLCLVVGMVSFPALLDKFSAGIDARQVGLIACIAAALACTGAVAVVWRFAILKRFVNEMRKSFIAPVVILSLAVMSTIIVYLGFAGFAALLLGMQIKVDTVFFLAVMPVIAVVASLPVTIGGWGVREGAMVAGLGIFGVSVEKALAVSVIFALAGLLVALMFGGMALCLWLLDSAVGGIPDRQSRATDNVE